MNKLSQGLSGTECGIQPMPTTSGLIARLVQNVIELKNVTERIRTTVYTPLPQVDQEKKLRVQPENINDYLSDLNGHMEEQIKQLHVITDDIQNRLGDIKII